VGRKVGRILDAKLMGWDKNSLTEQQKNQTATTIIHVRRIYKTRENIE